MRTLLFTLLAFILVEAVFYFAMSAALRGGALSKENLLYATTVGGVASAVLIGVYALMPSNMPGLRVSVFLTLLCIAAIGFYVYVATGAAV